MDANLVKLLGGSALLIYSMDQISSKFQYLAGSKVRIWVNTFAANRATGALLGIVLSLLMSSSGAVTVMLVGLANARLLTLRQILSVTLGAAVGSTFIVQLVAFRITDFALVIVALAVIGYSFSQKSSSRQASKGLLFLGLMFYSMTLVLQAGNGLQENEFFIYTVQYFQGRPAVSFFIAAILTAVIHSSAATIAFVMSIMLAQQGTIEQAVPWVLGANLGTTATAFLASVQGGVHGKQAALSNLLFKLGGITVCFPLMSYLAELASMLSDDLSRQVAHVHTLFNAGMALFFFPFIPLGAKLVQRLIPEKDNSGPFNFEYLDPQSISAPELALAQAQREIYRLSDTVEEMVSESMELFPTGAKKDDVDRVRSKDRVVDFLNKGIKLYLTKLSQTEMTPEQVHKEFELLLRTNDLESIGDIVDKGIVALAKKSSKKGYVFSKKGWEEITIFHKKVLRCLELSNAYFMSGDRSISVKLALLHEELEELMFELNEKHVYRLHDGVKASMQTTSVHLDLIGYLFNIASLSIQFIRAREIKGEE